MKKILISLLLLPLFSIGQEYTDFLPKVAWRTLVDSVVFQNTDTFTVKVNPLDLSDQGAFEKTVGNFLIDNKARKYKIIDNTQISNGIILTVEDVFKSGAAPYQGLVGYVIESPNGAFASGLSTYFGEKLDPTTEDYEKAIDLRIAYEKGQTIPFDSMRMDTNYIETDTEPKGTMYWDDPHRTYTINLGHGVKLQLGQESHVHVYNGTADTLKNQRIIGFGGVSNDRISAVYASKDERHTFFGATTEDIAPGDSGLAVNLYGAIHGAYTGSLVAGLPFYLDSMGYITNDRPSFPDYVYPLGTVTKEGAGDGIIFFRSDGINFRSSIIDAFDGAIRETFDFRTFSDGINVYGVLSNPTGSDKLTLMFSDGWWDYSVPDTITLITGTATNPQQSWVYIDKETRTLQSSISGFPSTEHAEIAKITLLDVANTNTYGALKNQNTNNHLKYTDNNGHIVHLGDRLRVINAQWEDGVALTVSGTPTNLYLATTSGHVWQLHKQSFEAQNMTGGDDVHVPNHPTTAYFTTTNLNAITTYSTGSTWNNQWQNLVVWGVANKTGEISHLMVNLASDGYLSESDAIADRNNYTNYTIPREFRGVGFLIARITVRRDPTGYTFNSGTGYLDLRGYYPNNTAGGGTGSSGITEFTQLDDTPSSYIGYGDSAVFVNNSEDGLEFRQITQSDVKDLVSELNTKQDQISLTTTGNSGAASLIGNVINVPNYVDGTGTLNAIQKWNGSKLTNSNIIDNGTIIKAFGVTLNNGGFFNELKTVADGDGTANDRIIVNKYSTSGVSFVKFGMTTLGNHRIGIGYNDTSHGLSIFSGTSGTSATSPGTLGFKQFTSANVGVGKATDNLVDKLQVNGTASFNPATLPTQGVILDQLEDGSLDVDFNSIAINGEIINYANPTLQNVLSAGNTATLGATFGGSVSVKSSAFIPLILDRDLTNVGSQVIRSVNDSIGFDILGTDNYNFHIRSLNVNPSISVKSNNLFTINWQTGNVGVGVVPTSDKLSVFGSFGVSGQIKSTVATGTAPFSITSTTLNTNLNADLLRGRSDYYNPSNSNLSTVNWSVANPTSSYHAVNLGYANANYQHIHQLPTFNMGESGIVDEYLVIAKKYNGTLVSGSGLIGTIFGSRGSSGAGNVNSKLEINILSAYNANVASELSHSGTNSFINLSTILIDGAQYWALKLRTYGGGFTNGAYFQGFLINNGNDPYILKRVRESDANVSFVSIDKYPQINYDAGNANLSTVNWSVANPTSTYHAVNLGSLQNASLWADLDYLEINGTERISSTGAFTGTTGIFSGLTNIGGLKITGNTIVGTGTGFEIYWDGTNSRSVISSYGRGTTGSFYPMTFAASSYNFTTGNATFIGITGSLFTVSGANNSTNWYTGYNSDVVSAAVTGTTTKTITFTKRDATTFSTNFTDLTGTSLWTDNSSSNYVTPATAGRGIRLGDGTSSIYMKSDYPTSAGLGYLGMNYDGINQDFIQFDYLNGDIDIKGDVFMPDINVKTSETKVLYYNETTKEVTQGDLATATPATYTTLGVASFDSTDFEVYNGHVSDRYNKRLPNESFTAVGTTQDIGVFYSPGFEMYAKVSIAVTDVTSSDMSVYTAYVQAFFDNLTNSFNQSSVYPAHSYTNGAAITLVWVDYGNIGQLDCQLSGLVPDHEYNYSIKIEYFRNVTN